MTGKIESSGREDSFTSSNFDFIFNSVADVEGATSETALESYMNECKVLIENNLNAIQMASKRLDEKDYNIAYLSRQIQELKLEISGCKFRIRSDDMKGLSSNTSTSFNSNSSTLIGSSTNSSRNRTIPPVTSVQTNEPLKRMPSHVRTKKSPKIHSSNSSNGGFFSPESSKSSSAPVKTPTLTEKQEQILKNAMELYGHKSSGSKQAKSSSSNSGWGFH